ncbi:hypothetical protein [Devosia chinhatensis]|uniref:DUF2059 domain-containing protein n=1 Tax=Devosia chinhatensis TaxID=429727 RepID=A0A0F5FNI6_9HYPH|nr:hypothetical protein [Devosia chinhatensis]KKB10105.1 hypothetical protein VE26_10065 [Devosia chinhatensis]
MNLPFNRLVGTAAFSAMLLVAPAAIAVEAGVIDGDRNVEHLAQLGRDLRELLRPEIGFPVEYVSAWQGAVDEAFAPLLLEADYVQALGTGLTQDARTAAIDHFQSSLAIEVEAQLTKIDPDNSLTFEEELEKAAEMIEAAPAELNALYVELFELQQGPDVANAVMDAYYRMMKTGAEPVIGAEAADEWVAGIGSTLRDQYVEGNFASTAAGYSTVDPDLLRELADVMADPDFISYSLQASQAFAHAIDAAADRLAVAYPRAIAEL